MIDHIVNIPEAPILISESGANLDYYNPFLKKKGPAPQPPTDKSGDCSQSNSLENGFSASSGLASGQVQAVKSVSVSRADSSQAGLRQTDNIKNKSLSGMTGSAPTSPLLSSKKIINDSGVNNICSPAEPNDWILQDGLLRCLRENQELLSPSPETEKSDQKDLKVPLSPKPWYKRNIVKESLEKKKDKKAKSPENLPEIHTSRECIKSKDGIEEKYGLSKILSKENLSEAPKSPKQFLRNKILPASPKIERNERQERPSSRPISGLTGISDLDRQAAEIIR